MQRKFKFALLFITLLSFSIPFIVLAQDENTGVAAALTATITPSSTPVSSPTPIATATTIPARLTVEAAAGVQAASSISVGETVRGELGSSTPSAHYTFEGEVGQIITITLSSSAFDAYLRLQDPSGVEVASDDDSAGSLNARIGPLTLAANGTYTITASTYSCTTGSTCTATGAYELNLDTASIERIEYTQNIEGELTADEPAIIYSFTGQQGDVISISMTSSDFDSYLRLAGSTPSYDLITNDDGGGNLNALIGPFTLPSTGEFLITASSLSGTAYGNFQLSLDKVTLESIDFGDSLETEITERTQSLYFSFEGSIGDVLNVNVTTEDHLDTTLSLNGPDNYQLTYDDDSGAGYNPEINQLNLNQSGTYTLVVRPYTPGDIGTLTVTLSRGAITSLDEGPQEVRLSDKQYQGNLTFEGAAGETVRMTIKVKSGSNPAPSVTVIQNGTTIANVNGGTVGELTFTFTVPANGTVNVQLSDYNYGRSILEVSLERVEEE